VSSVLRGITSRAWVVTIQAKDQVINVARRITGALASPLGMLGAGAGAYGIGKLTVGAAAQFEGYTASMEHWLKGNKTLAQETMKWAEKFSDVTPFTPEELFPGVARAVNIEKGMVEPAKRLVALSGEMAATQPGKTVLDAMEALADAKQGEFERMKEFGMKISQEEFRRLGGWKGFLKETESIFAGAMARFAKTSLGLLSTIIGKIKGLFRAAGFGMLEAIKPRLEKIVDWFDRNESAVERWKNNLARLGKEAFDKMFSWGEKALGKIEKRLSSPTLKNADWGTKLVAILDEAADIALPKAGEVGIKLGFELGKGLGSGIVKAAAEDPILRAILGAWIGSKVPGSIQVKLIVAGGIMAAPMVVKTTEAIGKKTPGTEYYTEQKVKEYTEAKAMPTIKGGEIRARKETFGERIKKNIGYAKGGILTRPHLGMVAEAGPEAVIPLSTQMRGRALKLWQQTGEILGTNKISSINTNIQNTAIGFESFDKGHGIAVKSIYKNYESRLKKATTLMEMEKIRETAHEAINLASKYRYIAKAFSRVALPLSLLTPVINIASTSDKKQAIINEVGQILGSAAAGVISPFTAMSGAIVGAGLSMFGGQAIARNLYNKRIAKHAEGGILTHPHLGLVAEAGPEAIIPLSPDKRSRAVNLFKQTADMLGFSKIRNIISLDANKEIRSQLFGDSKAIEFTNLLSARSKMAKTGATSLKSKFDISLNVPEIKAVKQVGEKIKTGTFEKEKVTVVTNKLREMTFGESSFFTSKLIDNIKNRIEKTSARNLYNKRIAKHAEGGFFIRPHLGLVAEAGPEAIIPLSAGKRSQAINLFQKVADILGLDRMGDLMTLEKGKTIQGLSEGTNIKNAFVYPVSAKLETATAKIVPLKPEFDIFTSVPEVGAVRQIGKKIKTNITEKINIMTEKLKEVITGASSFATKLVSSTKIIIEKTQQSMGAGFSGVISGPKELMPLAQSIAAHYGLPPTLLAAVIQAESSWNPRAISPIGAIGLTQVMPNTARAMGYNPAELARSPALQIEAGAKYLSQMLLRFKSIPLAVAAYNAGPGAVEKYRGIPPYKETRAYVNRVMSMFAKHEAGGVFTKPHLGLVAEAGMEAIIPLSSRRRTRAMDLWQRAGIILGAIPAVPELSSRATINPILEAISRIPGVVGKAVLKPEKILPKIPELIDKAVINQAPKRLPISPNLAGKVVINPALRAVSKLPSLISSISQLPFNLGREQLQIVEHATGGILTRPHLGLIAEAGPEVVIPLSSRMRTQATDLWQKVGVVLGATPKLPELAERAVISPVINTVSKLPELAKRTIYQANVTAPRLPEIKAHTLGGILTRPHLGMVAEAGPEAIIPLSARMRRHAIDIWKKTGEQLGVKKYNPEKDWDTVPFAKQFTEISKKAKSQQKQSFEITSLSKNVFKTSHNLAKVFSDMTMGFLGSVGGVVAGNVTNWIAAAMRITGVPVSWLAGLQKLVKAESGGNPTARNVIAVGGEHATGLLQTLPSTFRAYSQAGMTNIYNPIHNTVAAIKYIQSRYGSVYNTPLFHSGGKYVGYASGGIVNKPTLGLVGEAGPEAIIPLSSARKDFASNKNINVSVNGITVNMAGNEIDEEELAMKIGWQITKQIKKVLRNTA